jgi:hypothetical protein
VYWYIPIILALRRLSRRNEFNASLSYNRVPVQKKKKRETEKRRRKENTKPSCKLCGGMVVGLEVEPRALCMLTTCCTTELHTPALFSYNSSIHLNSRHTETWLKQISKSSRINRERLRIPEVSIRLLWSVARDHMSACCCYHVPIPC